MLPLAVWVACLTGLCSLGYIVFGVGLTRRYDGIGIRSLATFAVIWGCHFLLNSTVIGIIAFYGVTNGQDLASLTVPPVFELFLVVTTPLSGLLTVSAIFSWLWFVLTYTTRLDRNDRLSIVGLGAFVFVVTTLNGLIGALSSFGYLAVAPTFESQFHRFASTIEVLGTGVAVGAGTAQLYRSSQRHAPFAREAVVGLTLPVVLPYLVRYLYQFGLVTTFSTVELLRFGCLAVGLVGLVAAVRRYDVFGQLPASQAVGRETAFETTETPIVLTDANGRVADLNPAATSLFDVAPAAVIGDSVAELPPAAADAPTFGESGRTTLQFPNSDRIVETETTPTTSDNDREIGRTIVCTDITDERRRQQRIQVLNRALRHNLRNELSIARGYVELLSDEDLDDSTHATRALAALDSLATMGDKARRIQRVLGSDVTVDDPHALASVVEDAFDTVRRAHPDVRLTTDVPAESRVAIRPLILQSVLEELVENGVVHTDGSAVHVSFDATDTALVVEDDGPGIPAHEVEVFDTEWETSLQHGSGLGLWLVKWGVDRFGGTVGFDATDGTSVTVSIPPDLVTHSEAR